MIRANRRWAVLFQLCAAFAVARGANAANPKFTPLIPMNPDAQAQIAARNEAAQKLYQSFYGTKKVDWRKDPKFLKALSGQLVADPNADPNTVPPSNKQVPVQAGTNSGAPLGTGNSNFSAFNAARPTSVHATGTASTKASATFGGFLDTPSYPALPYPAVDDYAMATATADFNNDGYPDLVSVDVWGNLNVLLNDGKGGFSAPVVNTGGAQYVTSQMAPLVWVTPGDVNGDGLADLVVTKWGDMWVSAYGQQPESPELLVYLNQGNGKFSNPTVVNPILGPNEQLSAIVVTDRDGDHKADIVAVSYTEIDHYDPNGYINGYDTQIAVQTLYSNGDGTFKNYGDIAHYTYPGYSLITPNGGAQFITLGGTKYLAVECEVYGLGPTSVGTGILFFQDSTGARHSQPVANAPSREIDFPSNSLFALTFSNGLSLTDINGDGLPDITLSFADGYLYGALGTPDGGFAPPQMIENGNLAFYPSGWAVADVNADGYPDMIDMELNYIAIWMGKGDGTFADPKNLYSGTTIPATGYAGSNPGNNLVTGDFDRDGIMDFATNDGSYEIRYGRSAVYKGRGDGTFAAMPVLAPVDRNLPPTFMGLPWPLDLNRDGISDIVALNRTDNGLITGINDGDGHFTYRWFGAPPSGNGFQIFRIAGVGDFNRDGLPDVLLSGYLLGDTYKGTNVFSLAVALSKGDGSFSDPIPISNGATSFLLSPISVLIGDINHDGFLDVVEPYRGDHEPGRGHSGAHTPSGVFVALGRGDGTFQTGSYYPLGKNAWSGALADVNKDGFLDLVLFDSGNWSVNILPGNATGTYSEQGAIPLGSDMDITTIVPVDVNNDGKIDLAFTTEGPASSPDYSGSGVAIYTNNGDGTFSLTNTLESGYGNPDVDMVTADFNGDGCADLFTSSWLASATATENFYGGHILLGNCDGTFQDPQSVLLPPASVGLATGTFTRDGVTSITASSSYGAPFILFNQAGTSVSLTASQNAIVQGGSVSFAANVQPTWQYRPVPEGTISFYDNRTLLGTEPVAAGGASFSTSNLTVGSHTITISYSGDENFNPQQNAAQVNVTVTAPVIAPPEISISVPDSNVTLHDGESKTVTLTLAGSASYTGSVKFSVSGASKSLGVSVNPTTVSLSNGGPATVSVVVTAGSGTTAALAKPLPLMGVTLSASVFGMFFAGTKRRRRRSIWLCLLIVQCATGLCLLSSGCSSGGSHTTVPVSSTIVVTATPSVSGASVQTATFRVTVE